MGRGQGKRHTNSSSKADILGSGIVWSKGQDAERDYGLCWYLYMSRLEERRGITA